MTILVIAEHDNAWLRRTTLNTLAAAAVIAALSSHDVHVLVAGYNTHAVAATAAGVAGVAKVLLADAPHLAEDLAENIAGTVFKIVTEYSCVLAPTTAYGTNIAARIAARLDVAQIGDIAAVDGPDIFE